LTRLCREIFKSYPWYLIEGIEQSAPDVMKTLEGSGSSELFYISRGTRCRDTDFGDVIVYIMTGAKKGSRIAVTGTTWVSIRIVGKCLPAIVPALLIRCPFCSIRKPECAHVGKVIRLNEVGG
jgi:hypothetical protein